MNVGQLGRRRTGEEKEGEERKKGGEKGVEVGGGRVGAAGGEAIGRWPEEERGGGKQFER